MLFPIFARETTGVLAAANPEPLVGVLSCCLQLVLLVGGSTVPAIFVKKHYDLDSIWSGIGIILLSGIMTGVVFCILIAGLFFVSMEFGDTIFTEWVLRPLDLV